MKRVKTLIAAALVLTGLSLGGCASGSTTFSVGVGVGYPYGWGGMGSYGWGTGGVHYGGYWR